METFRKFLLALIGWIIMVGVGIVVLVYGWGLWPEHWWIVILGNTFGFMVGQLFIAVAK